MYNAGRKKAGIVKFSQRVFESIYEFGKYLEENPEEVKYTDECGESTISFKMLKSSSKSFHIIFYDKSLLRQCKKTRIYVDGTFYTLPLIKGISQFVTIMAKLDCIVSSIMKLYN